VYCCARRHWGHVVPPYCCATQQLPRNPATRRAKRGEGRGGQEWQRSATVVQSCSVRFLNFSSSHMGRLHHNINIVAYLPHAKMVKPQKQPFLSTARTENGTAGLYNLFLGYSSVNTFLRRCSDITLQQCWLTVTCLLCDIPDATVELCFQCMIFTEAI
jgi:hypothetical protein